MTVSNFHEVATALNKDDAKKNNRQTKIQLKPLLLFLFKIYVLYFCIKLNCCCLKRDASQWKSSYLVHLILIYCSLCTKKNTHTQNKQTKIIFIHSFLIGFYYPLICMNLAVQTRGTGVIGCTHSAHLC